MRAEHDVALVLAGDVVGFCLVDCSDCGVRDSVPTKAVLCVRYKVICFQVFLLSSIHYYFYDLSGDF